MREDEALLLLEELEKVETENGLRGRKRCRRMVAEVLSAGS